MERISVVIPHYPFSKEIDDTLAECVASLNGHDELVVVANTGLGYARAVNMGLRLAKGDYICVVNNDIKLTSGNIRDLAVKDTVTSPAVNNMRDGFHGAFWCIPRTVIDSVGLLDERFEGGYWEDVDLLRRLKDAGFETKCVESVVVSHEGGKTIKAIGKELEYSEANKKRYQEKWGDNA